MKICRRTFITAAAALAAVPRFVWGQRARIPRVALVDRGEVPANMAEEGHPYWGALLRELRRLGYVDRESISIERWSGRGKTSAEFTELAHDVVATRPDVIVARSGENVRNFRAATATIPIVVLGTFPLDLFARIARPGGNVTGMDATAGGGVHEKRFQLLYDAVPSASRIAMLGQRGGFWADERRGGRLRAAAEQLGLTLLPVFVETPITEDTIRRAVASLAGGGFDAVYLDSFTAMYAHRTLIAQQLAATRLPAMAFQSEYAKEGVLLAYAPNFVGTYRRLASLVDRILKGADPGEMPIELPNEFDFVVNLATARKIGITLSLKIMLGATEVIE